MESDDPNVPKQAEAKRDGVINPQKISKTYLCTSDKSVFSNKKYYSYKCWTCAELCDSFTFFMENIYMQFEGMVYQQIVGFPLSTTVLNS